MHALIIEDDELIAMAIEDILRDCGFSSFAVAVSFDDAIAAAAERESRVDHGRCGAVARIRDRRSADDLLPSRSIPVIFITGRPTRCARECPTIWS